VSIPYDEPGICQRQQLDGSRQQPEKPRHSSPHPRTVLLMLILVLLGFTSVATARGESDGYRYRVRQGMRADTWDCCGMVAVKTEVACLATIIDKHKSNWK
jgi:hypothetical protein